MTARIEPFPSEATPRPGREEAEAAVRTLLAYLGDDATREGLRDTPARVIDSYAELFGGYGQDAVAELSRTFEDVSGYGDMVLVRDVAFHSHCEHHMMPIEGVAHIAYVPRDRVVGFSKLARAFDVFARRLQTQEALTMQVADAIERALSPRGIAIQIEAQHACMVSRGIAKPGVSNVTSHFSGSFADDKALRARFLDLTAKR